MNLFLMFMAGNSISIFPIMMVGMMLLRPIKALWATTATFRTIEGGHAGLQVGEGDLAGWCWGPILCVFLFPSAYDKVFIVFG